MATKPLKKLNSKDRIINLLQDNVEDAINSIIKDQFNNANILTDIVLVAGQDNTINHKLGRELQGWQVIRKRGLGDVYDVQDANTLPKLTLVLRTSVNVTVDLRVF